ncbi:hypothetical protein A2118_00860 [Candidatus Kaiserbacteria bacterium GWA2_50_9]|uniref:8-oxo-dGTP diphosphatase n=1 Tax=Candidatus Kaiserbacteria bacterium GWA2_50_9 TaxID=1798474 RepID=A0A1F6BUF4_9BACT|nr:MAG: hypothetical protein A2118_00860 [Candidatus Kaiserbacteria bacterium GWA2_50_9]
MDKKVDIHKAAGILIKDRKLLMSRSKGKEFFISPGGKIQSGETPEGALIRELDEELGIEVAVEDLEKFGTFHSLAVEQTGEKHLQMDVFLVNRWKGDIQPNNEIEEIKWINSLVPDGIKLGSIFEHDVLPRLKKEDLID